MENGDPRAPEPDAQNPIPQLKHFLCAHTKEMGRLNGQINLITWPGGVKGGAELRGTFNEPIEGTQEYFFCVHGGPKTAPK